MIRLCDCGCKRPAVLSLPEVDLVFSLKCIEVWRAACTAYGIDADTQDLLLGYLQDEVDEVDEVYVSEVAR